MLEQSEGLMQNMTLHTPVELVTCESTPQKDSGVVLLPLEKMKFATCGNEQIFAKCTKLDGTIATLSVVNLHDPVKSVCNNKQQKTVLVPRLEKFEVAGIYEWTVLQDGWYKATVTGAGGGSCKALAAYSVAAGAGGGGGTAVKNVYLRKGELISIIVGGGGKGSIGNGLGDSNMNGIIDAANGSSSSFGSYCSATGGIAGQSVAQDLLRSMVCGNGGAGVGGDINFRGSKGRRSCLQSRMQDQSVDWLNFSASLGGISYYGDFVVHNGADSIHGGNGQFGCGGNGGLSNIHSVAGSIFSGGNGGDGVVVIEWTEAQ